MNATQILKQSHTGSHMRAVACRAGPRTQTQPLSAVARGTMAVGAAIVVACTPAFADLNKFEAATGGSAFHVNSDCVPGCVRVLSRHWSMCRRIWNGHRGTVR